MLILEDLPELFRDCRILLEKLDNLAGYKRKNLAEESVIRLDVFSVVHRAVSISMHPWSRRQFGLLLVAAWMIVNALHDCDSLFLYKLETFQYGAHLLSRRMFRLVQPVCPGKVMRTQIHLLKVLKWQPYSHCLSWGLK